MSPCDIPFRVRIFLIFSPSFLLINISTAYEILHFQTILYYNSSGSGGANQKFPFLHFRLSAGGEGGAGKNGKEIFGFARASPRARPRRVPAQSGRTLRVQATTHAERAKSAAPWLEMGSRKG